MSIDSLSRRGSSATATLVIAICVTIAVAIHSVGSDFNVLAAATPAAVIPEVSHDRTVDGNVIDGNPMALEQPDKICSSCHQQIYDRYQRTPMANGSGMASHGLTAGQLAIPGFTHQPSRITYKVYLRDGGAWMSYDRSGDNRAAIHGVQGLDYYVGSGRRGRTYLFQQEGFWFETPINWYGKKQIWDMAPNYGAARTMPYTLPVDANCLHCHAGLVQTPLPDARNRYAGPPFKAGGIGCAACHGDPSAHLSGVNGKPGTGPILNPDKLSATKRDSVCLQCHLEGDAAVYRAGKSLASYKAGEELNNYAVYFINASREQLGGRASSQYEALLLSACKRASGDKLTCTTCHDPHGSPSPEERVASFRSRCISCHGSPAIASQHHAEQQDCAVCHMPTRKTEDISHEQLTDHNIQKYPASTETISLPGGPINLIAVGNVKAGDRELGLAYAQMAQHGNRAAGEKAMSLLEQAENGGAHDSDVQEQLAFLKQVSGDVEGAARLYTTLLQQKPRDPAAAANLAVFDASRGKVRDAMRLLEQVVRTDPTLTAAGLNLAFLQCKMGDKVSTRKTIDRMLQFNPDNAEARQFKERGSYGGKRCDVN